MSKGRSTGCIASRRACAQAAACMARIWPPNARVIRCSSSSRTSRAKSTPVAAAIARTASWTGLPSITPQVARGSPIRRALWSSRVVAMPASPGATILGPPLNPAKKCGSTKPVVIRRSAATHSRSSRTGTSPTFPRSTWPATSRASWSSTRHCASTSSPSIARRSSMVDARWVPVAIRTTTSSGRMMPSSASMIARSMRGRGWGRVMSHTEIATR